MSETKGQCTTWTLTTIVRQADRQFERCGGGTRHWVRDCFLPELEAANLKIVSTDWRDQQPAIDEARKWVEAGYADGVAATNAKIERLQGELAEARAEVERLRYELTRVMPAVAK